MFKGRYSVAIGMFLLALLLYIDRICIAVAKDQVTGELGLSDAQFGWVLSAFTIGYALFQVPGGSMGDKYGARKVLTGIVSIWSVFTGLTGAVFNYVQLLIVRFLFGAGEAGAFPAMSRAIFSWFPIKERGIIIGLNFSGSRLGAAFAVPLVAWLITDFGWRNAFFILGIIGVLWAVLWWIGFRDSPEEHPLLPEAEKEEIMATRQQVTAEEALEKLSAKELLKSKNMWIAMGQYFCSNFTFFFALTWLFPHLKSTYNLDMMEASWYAVAPFVAGAFGNWVAGYLVDSLYKSKTWNFSRKAPAIIGFILAAGGLLASVFMTTPLGAVIMLSIAIFGADMTLPPSWAFCVDIGKKNTGTVSGTMNMAGNFGSFFTALAFPYLAAWTGSYDYFFYLAAILNVLAIFLWMRADSERGLAY